MREKLIQRIKDVSVEVDDDDLDWVNWNEYSNDRLLDMLEQLAECRAHINMRAQDKE